MAPPRSRATSTVTSPDCPVRSERADPGQSGRSGAWTLDDQPGLIQHPISASSRVRPSAAATDLMSGATALGGIFSARAISFGVRPASLSSRTRSSNGSVGISHIMLRTGRARGSIVVISVSGVRRGYVRGAVQVAVIALDELKIPSKLKPLVDEIVAITDEVCLAVLDEEYADLARRAVAKLSRKRPSPLPSGRRTTWAAGVVYALGQVNFLSDRASEPCVTADQLSAAFGVAKSTMSSKARRVSDLLRISYFSPEFQRADVVAQNSLVWIIEVNGLAVDARHVPPDIQVEAFHRGLIPYIPALGPDGTAARAESESQVNGTPPVASAAAAPSEPAEVLARCSDLKRQLVEFARSARFSVQLDQVLRESSDGKAVGESDDINIIDHFILQRPLPGGGTVVETFVSARPDLTEADRQMLLGWREVVEGIFEIRERDGDAIIVVNLIDELTYRVWSNVGPGTLAPMEPGRFMIARIVPIDVGWVLSGMQHMYGASQRAVALEVAAELATGHPRLVFRNPEKVTKGWELAAKQRAMFIEFFGSDLVVVPGPEVASRINGFFTWYTRRALEEAGSAETSVDANVAASTPAFRVPAELASAPTVAVACDETEGLMLLANFGLVQEAFENPGLAADPDHRQAVLGYLKADSISAAPFRWLAARDPARASQLFQHLLKKTSFSWERDGEALLRKHKPWCFGARGNPPVTPLTGELARARRGERLTP